MTDVGEIIGSLMTGLINARRVADEHTAALAEHYKDNPLLEGLSIPRIRIPELTVDMPILLEEFEEARHVEMKAPDAIANDVLANVKTTISGMNVDVDDRFYNELEKDILDDLHAIKEKGHVVRESVIRSVQDVLSKNIKSKNIELSLSNNETLNKEMRKKIYSSCIVKESKPTLIKANAITADVKEKASPNNVVRIKITLKEEGLEWTSQVNDSGQLTSTLQPE